MPFEVAKCISHMSEDGFILQNEGIKNFYDLSCRLSTVRNATNIVVMKAGRITEQGTHAQLMMQRGIYYSLVKRQAGDGTLGTGEEENKKVSPALIAGIMIWQAPFCLLLSASCWTAATRF